METIDRRTFIKNSSVLTAGTYVGSPLIEKALNHQSPNNAIHVAVIGIRSRGRDHYRALTKIPNVKIATLCDIDQRLLPEAVAEVEKLTGYKPATETEYRKVLEDKNIDVVSIATPNHWHALQTIWACQAGKDVYVEKPVSHTVQEGRKMVEELKKSGVRYRKVRGLRAESSSLIRLADSLRVLARCDRKEALY